MMNELFLYDRDNGLFKEILKQSIVINGRYHVSPNYGKDLNVDSLNSYINDPKYGLINPETKYPICVCITPKSQFRKINGGSFEIFFFELFFLTRSNHDGSNNIKSINKDTNTSRQDAWDDWSVMKDCAREFEAVLHQVIQKKDYGGQRLKSLINVDPTQSFIRRYSNYNNDNINGVSLSFNLLQVNGCSVSSYKEDFINNISIPDTWQ